MGRITGSSSGGIVQIQDSNGNPISSSGGSLNVTVTGSSPGSSVSLYNEITNIAVNATTAILTYTVPMGQSLALTRIELSGSDVGIITVDIDGVTNMKKRLYYTSYNMTLDYNNSMNGYSLPAGTVITVNATNRSTSGVASYNATLQGVLT